MTRSAPLDIDAFATGITEKVLDVVEAAEAERRAGATRHLSAQEWCRGLAEGLMAAVVIFSFSAARDPDGDRDALEDFLRNTLDAAIDGYEEPDEEGSMVQ